MKERERAGAGASQDVQMSSCPTMPYGVDLDRIDRPRECKHLCGRDQARKGALRGLRR